jgi:glucose-6-phosphate isomerase/transaldolase/glucose-6-phosphate isomerase
MRGTDFDAEALVGRLFDRDKTLWPDGNVAWSRLGWLEVPREIERQARDLRSWAKSIDEETIVLLGMGGSSLGPLVLDSLAQAFGQPFGRRVFVCDTTEPSTVASMPFETSFVLVSSKSGTTLEPNVLFDYALTRQKDPSKYAVITDEGTPLSGRAQGLGVNRVFHNRADIGGRYSVLSHFGMVPAVLLGYDLEELCGRAMETDRHAAAELGIALGSHALSGADKATFVIEEAHRSFGLWVEQLIAESTGKLGRGIVPVPTSERESGDDRYLVDIDLKSAHEVGELFMRFEIATAIAGHVLGIDPFDEPNVAESKANTLKVLDNLPLLETYSAPAHELRSFIEEALAPNDYVSIQAYLPFGNDGKLEALRRKIRDEFAVATTAGYGPRFLHSTGQLHKGGPAEIVAIQIVPAAPRESVPIPGKPYDFGTLIDAQAIGDQRSLMSHDRMVIRIATDDLDELI